MDPGPLDFHDFQALTLRLRQGSLLVVAAYLDPSIGIRGPNLVKLSLIDALLGTVATDWIIMAD